MKDSMINPSIVDLVRIGVDKYSVVVITAMRARQIISGSRPLIDSDITKPLTIAINEFYEGKFDFTDPTIEGIK
ncbi:DNA-directed RNA polymerase subunit omega [Clostridium akagii]|uniref:DNA-directed RNA polymerase subunit omega n=1 Tax=Clostridium akagii TaxID=91623 RepID=UPI0004792BE5|nr:DNA-directed RNA polymerase subunit omega [Clostridium akagii]